MRFLILLLESVIWVSRWLFNRHGNLAFLWQYIRHEKWPWTEILRPFVVAALSLRDTCSLETFNIIRECPKRQATGYTSWEKGDTELKRFCNTSFRGNDTPCVPERILCATNHHLTSTWITFTYIKCKVCENANFCVTSVRYWYVTGVRTLRTRIETFKTFSSPFPSILKNLSAVRFSISCPTGTTKKVAENQRFVFLEDKNDRKGGKVVLSPLKFCDSENI